MGSAYQNGGACSEEGVADNQIEDGGVWGKPVFFADLAHMIVPREFVIAQGAAEIQEIDRLAQELTKHGVSYRLVPDLLEVKQGVRRQSRSNGSSST